MNGKLRRIYDSLLYQKQAEINNFTGKRPLNPHSARGRNKNTAG